MPLIEDDFKTENHANRINPSEDVGGFTTASVKHGNKVSSEYVSPDLNQDGDDKIGQLAYLVK